MVKKIIVVLTALMLVSCSMDQNSETEKSKASTGEEKIIAQPLPRENALSDSETRQASRAGHQLIFFIDPYGHPCQMQDQIIKGMADDFKNQVDLRYVQTTVASDRDIFYQYGIRALPTLVLTDTAGNEVGRLTPGVKNADDILRLINTIPGL